MKPTELHLHLDGSLRPATVRALAAEHRLTVPPDLLFHAGMGLADALARFAFTLSLIQRPAEVRRVAAEICEDSGDLDGLEIRFAPQLHQGAEPEAIVDAALDGIAGRAGLILCGLYGEPTAMLDRLVEIARTRHGVVAIDLAGGPAPAHAIRLQDYAPAFTRARDLGIHRTVHASEGRPPEEIRIAIEHLHAERIGHGTTLLDAPRVLDLVLERGVTIEACPTSNVHTGVIPNVNAHPLPIWLSKGVKASVCADNTLLSDTTTQHEHDLATRMPGMTPALLERVIANGKAARFSRR